MRTLMRHGLAVCLALTTMCTSLLLVYSSLGGQRERPPQRRQQQQQQQQQDAAGSAPPAAASSPPARARMSIDDLLCISLCEQPIWAGVPEKFRPSASDCDVYV
ncbi:alpha-N-acetylgalactosaminide alpha-2,6-sialyltransferase 5-like [Vulpes lagopus]|uniref:alpha-N-acetylgalactosaminide alpha-2,6-sialyltransferase 5-like n=1 Tax=Vulpes lagopus TaxID=494514 RepID=UPI001BC92A72|nr:alpha-N-acetylgalactosaminide alpha-2,6-sialyltransferase 5-like [Vulpes lagopus]